jgi:hypothetical protein
MKKERKAKRQQTKQNDDLKPNQHILFQFSLALGSSMDFSCSRAPASSENGLGAVDPYIFRQSLSVWLAGLSGLLWASSFRGREA